MQSTSDAKEAVPQVTQIQLLKASDALRNGLLSVLTTPKPALRLKFRAASDRPRVATGVVVVTTSAALLRWVALRCAALQQPAAVCATCRVASEALRFGASFGP
jgi:hypothetical protein